MLWQLRRLLVLVAAAGLGCGLLVYFAPGTGVDERELDRRLSEDSIREIRSSKGNLWRSLSGFAYSESNHAPIAGLIADRAPETLREIAVGLAGGWLLGLALAIPKRGFSLLAGLLLSIPTALIAYFCVAAGAKSILVLVVVLTPRIFRFARNLIVQAYTALYVDMARARGITETRILFAHVLPSISPQLLALAAASASMAIGAAIPIEAICDVPGLGRLAWNAAMARDLPLLVNLTMLMAIATSAATALAEMANPKS